MSRPPSCSRVSLALICASVVSSLVAFAVGCGGLLDHHGATEFAYIATGTAIAQYVVLPTGQLSPLRPPTAPATNSVAIAVVNSSFAYVASQSDGVVDQFSVGEDGNLIALSPASVHSGTSPAAIATSPNGQFVYVLDQGDNAIAQFSANVDGTLRPLAPPTVPIPSGGNGLAITPNGSFLYATSSASNKMSAFSIGVSGQLTPLAVPSYTVASPARPAITADGSWLYVPLATAGIAQFSVVADGSLSALTPPVETSPSTNNDTISVSPTGRYAYLGCAAGAAGSPVAQYRITANGTLSPLSPASVAAGNSPVNVAVDLGGHFVYVANNSDSTVSQFAISGTGTLVALAPATIRLGGAMHIAFSLK